jgi:hypothetical protein
MSSRIRTSLAALWALSLGYSLAGGVEGGRGARIHEQVFLVGEDWVLDA